jgi:hypothetical protein
VKKDRSFEFALVAMSPLSKTSQLSPLKQTPFQTWPADPPLSLPYDDQIAYPHDLRLTVENPHHMSSQKTTPSPTSSLNPLTSASYAGQNPPSRSRFSTGGFPQHRQIPGKLSSLSNSISLGRYVSHLTVVACPALISGTYNGPSRAVLVALSTPQKPFYPP